LAMYHQHCRNISILVMREIVEVDNDKD
jgi:hypothetical protein